MKIVPQLLLVSGLLLGCANSSEAADKPDAAVANIARMASSYLSCTAKRDRPEESYIPIRGGALGWEAARKKLTDESGQADTPCGFYETHARIVDQLGPDYPKMQKRELEYQVYQTMDQLRKINRGIYLWQNGAPGLPIVAPPPRVVPPASSFTPRDPKNAEN